MKKNVVELFAGVGGFRCAFNSVKLLNGRTIESKKWKFLWANQWEPSSKTQDAFNCYKARFGSKEISNVDIFQVDKKNIPNHAVLVGGFPCQDYSVAQTLKNSKGIEGKKGVLWWAIAEVLKVKQPPFVLLENVDRLLISPSKQKGRDFSIILRTFCDLGYDVQWRVVNSAEYCAPQKRRRIFIFAYNKKTKYYKETLKYSETNFLLKNNIFSKAFPILDSKCDYKTFDVSKTKFKTILEVSKKAKFNYSKSGISKNGKIFTFNPIPKVKKSIPLKDVIENNVNDKRIILTTKEIQKMTFLKKSKKILRKLPSGYSYFYSEGSMQFPDDLNAPSRTMLTSEGTIARTTHIVKQNTAFRFLTPLECERLNEFPDNWTKIEGISNRKRYFLMGNALVISTVSKISKEISKIIERE